MRASACAVLALAAILAAGGNADAQRTPRDDRPLSPYLDPKNPLFQLPPDPAPKFSVPEPAPVQPEIIPDRQKLVPAPFPEGLTPRNDAPFPQGFTMTINRAGLSMASGELIRPRQLAEQIAACWQPPAASSEVTVRVAFNRQGAVIGRPRVTYVKPGQGTDRASGVGSMEQAFSRCAPLRLSADLGSAIAGRPFAIRFIAPGASRP